MIEFGTHEPDVIADSPNPPRHHLARGIGSIAVLGAGEAEVHIAAVDDVVRYGDPGSVISNTEAKRARAMKYPGSFRRFVAARCMLRRLLSRSVQDAVAPSQWRFRIGPYGKPAVAGGLPPIFFNVSHAGEHVAVALSRSGEVGVDLEQIEVCGAEPLADVLCARERRALAARKADVAERRFIDLWSAKEACAKALGFGSAMDFRLLDIELERRRAHCRSGGAGLTLDIDVVEVAAGDARYCLATAAVDRGMEPAEIHLKEESYASEFFCNRSLGRIGHYRLRSGSLEHAFGGQGGKPDSS
jgi:phosphopantetheine--protein transferase-like protein